MLKWLNDWVNDEPDSMQKTAQLVIKMWLLIFLLRIILGVFFELILEITQVNYNGQCVTRRASNAANNGALLGFIQTLLVAAVLEEVLFRILPLFIAVRFLSFRWIIFIGMISSILFGYAHGYQTVAIETILKATMAGSVFTAIFLKCGGLKGKILKPSLCVLGIHLLNNILALGATLLLISIGEA